jgi:hypothetical protein
MPNLEEFLAVSGGNVAVRLTGGTGTGERSQVLLRIEQQTHKLDTWAAGALLAALLTGRYPFFDGGADDQAALMEFVALFGAAKVTLLSTVCFDGALATDPPQLNPLPISTALPHTARSGLPCPTLSPPRHG